MSRTRKFTDKQVIFISLQLHKGKKPKDIAVRMKLKRKQIYNIIHNYKIGLKKYCKW